MHGYPPLKIDCTSSLSSVYMASYTDLGQRPADCTPLNSSVSLGRREREDREKGLERVHIAWPGMRTSEILGRLGP